MGWARGARVGGKPERFVNVVALCCVAVCAIGARCVAPLRCGAMIRVEVCPAGATLAARVVLRVLVWRCVGCALVVMVVL